MKTTCQPRRRGGLDHPSFNPQLQPTRSPSITRDEVMDFFNRLLSFPNLSKEVDWQSIILTLPTSNYNLTMRIERILDEMVDFPGFTYTSTYTHTVVTVYRTDTPVGMTEEFNHLLHGLHLYDQFKSRNNAHVDEEEVSRYQRSNPAPSFASCVRC